MPLPTPPTLDVFLAADEATVAAIAPPTAVYALGGTRRRATMEGIPLDRTYIDRARPEMVTAIDRFFRHGIRHLIVPALGPRQPAEGGIYGQKILEWIVYSLAGPAMVEDYRRHGWRARFIVPSPIPELQAAAAELAAATPGPAAHTVWFYLVGAHPDPWLNLLAAAHDSGARSRNELVRVLYGDDVPPATLVVGFGKPTTGTTLIPPLLIGGEMHCYWTQRAGLRLTDAMLRRILYDFAYARPTFAPDRATRYAHAAEQHARWDTTGILGVGSQEDGFWYPDPFPPPGEDGAGSEAEA